MISSVLALLLLAGAPADPGAARKAYSNCLTSFVQASAGNKLSPDDFDARIQAACATEEQAFRKSVIASDVARGISRRTSEQGIADEVTDYLATARERYRGLAASARP